MWLSFKRSPCIREASQYADDCQEQHGDRILQRGSLGCHTHRRPRALPDGYRGRTENDVDVARLESVDQPEVRRDLIADSMSDLPDTGKRPQGVL